MTQRQLRSQSTHLARVTAHKAVNLELIGVSFLDASVGLNLVQASSMIAALCWQLVWSELSLQLGSAYSGRAGPSESAQLQGLLELLLCCLPPCLRSSVQDGMF